MNQFYKLRIAATVSVVGAAFLLLGIHGHAAVPGPRAEVQEIEWQTKTLEDFHTASFSINGTTIKYVPERSMLSFFKFYLSHKDPEKRGKLESQEAYEKRLINTYPDSVSMYLEAEFDSDKEDDEFDYDQATKTLRLYRGSQKSSGPFTIERVVEEPRYYNARNGYGAEVKVKEMNEQILSVYINNRGSSEAGFFDRKRDKIGFDIKCSLEEAKDIVAKTKIIFKFKPRSHKRSSLELVDYHKPTFDYPYKLTIYRYNFDVNIESAYILAPGREPVEVIINKNSIYSPKEKNK